MNRWLPLPLLLVLPACSPDEAERRVDFPTGVATRALVTYKEVVHRNYEETLAAARALRVAVDAFVAAPSPLTHEAAKQAWIAARVPYGPSEAYRFYDGPIDDPVSGPEAQLNGWPLDENYIDATRDEASSGLVNDLVGAPELSTALLAAANEAKGERSIATGYHAIEFLLWGQDDPTPGTGPGKRPHTDYLAAEAGGTRVNPDRRGQYLRLAAQLLVEQLEQLAVQWRPETAGSFASSFGTPETPGAPRAAIADILRALGSMANAELSGERMAVAYKHRSQEDEHSCFSDTTSADLLGNGLGIQNVWHGRYGALDGVGVDEVVAAVDPAVAAEATRSIELAVGKLSALRELQAAGKPFDLLIAAPDGSLERVAVQETMQALKQVADDLQRAARALGLTVESEQPSEA